MISVYEKDDVTPEVLEAAAEAEEWFADDARVDWDRFWDRLEESGVFVGDVSSPAARAIEAYVRKIRRDAL